jgi:serine/threonine protein phosphatase PrpC
MHHVLLSVTKAQISGLCITHAKVQICSYGFAHDVVSGEAERILKCKGRVFALEDEPEVARVWLPYDDAPGLAMARAFGDFCLKDYGLIAVPDVMHRKVVPEDEFIVLATDGVSSLIL